MSDVLGLLGLGLLENLFRAFEARLGSHDARQTGRDLSWTGHPAADRIGRGLNLLDAGHAHAALQAFEAAVTMDPTCTEARMGMACALDAIGKPQAAADRLMPLVRRNEPDPLTLFAVGYCRERAGQTDLARDAYLRTAALCPQLCNAHERLVAIYVMQGDYSDATRHCETIYKGDPARIDIRRAVAGLSLLAGEPADAVDHYQTALTLEPDNWAAEGDEADALIQAGKHEEAALVLEQLAESQPGFADTYLRLGEVYTKLEKHDEAISNLIRAVELHPDYLEASSKLAALLLRVGQGEQAAKWFAHGAEINDRLLAAYTGLGLAQLRLGQQKEGQASIAMAARIEPNSPLLFSEVARVRRHLMHTDRNHTENTIPAVSSTLVGGDEPGVDWLDDTIATYRQLLASRSNHAQWHYQVGLLLRQRGDLPAATSHYQQAVTINAAYSRAWVKLALALHEAGRQAEVITALERSISPGPELIQLHYQLAAVFTLPARFEISVDQLEAQMDAIQPRAEVRANIRLALENMNLLDPISAGLLTTPFVPAASEAGPFDDL